MTREEQIIEKAGKDSEIFYKVNDNYGDCFHGGFIDGAKWADANPQFSKEEFIEKACKWLQENVSKYSYVIKVGDTEYKKVHFMDSLIEDFSKTMEE